MIRALDLLGQCTYEHSRILDLQQHQQRQKQRIITIFGPVLFPPLVLSSDLLHRLNDFDKFRNFHWTN
ncbi:uncharacterized protein I303_104451 [Kwoniella dejecticola CBS 10117]|uniref:Uncharacterized protein n=1 Tax=Kwoniella dejecticola CBS 10117 TaxID=1296121 RepID=A0AAJ8MGZ7_9TREE